MPVTQNRLKAVLRYLHKTFRIACMKDEAKQRVASLVERYKELKSSGKLGRYSEEETKKDFILPLFEALGWDVYKKEDVSAEESISSKRVDYGFYLNGRPQFYLEAKPFKADLNREDYANQAIQYSWNKGVTWAVLTDFENIKIFNAQDIEASLWSKQFKNISYDEFVKRFDELWLLSKESFKEDLLDKEADKAGKKLQKISVTKKLYEDLNEARELLTRMFFAWNPSLKSDPYLVDEGVQRVLDRIMFIRVAEDRKIEPPTLRPLVREWESRWESGKVDKLLYQSMVEKFQEFDQIYNSHIFSAHPSDSWEEHKNIVKEIIEMFYGKQGYYEYDFSAISADVLGTVYEQYLGHRLSQTKKGKVSSVTFSKDAKKRKEQGIYYTPSYIVDYIVDQTLGQTLKKCKTIEDLQKLKVLDPACGSGSFLVKAFELIYKKYEEFGSKGEAVKLQILINNIYGVDLDEQAVEIARLNLLLAALEERARLPNLTNIKNGNSLISGTDVELKKYFGNSWQEKKPFNWKDEFPEVFKSGGFNVIIGNPPWGADITKDYQYLSEYYPESTKEKKDTYKTFIDKAIQLLKPEGNFGFVVPNSFLYQPSYEDIKKMVEQYSYEVINLGEKIFSGVELPCCILILKKSANDIKKSIIDLTQQKRSSLQAILIESDFDEYRNREESRSKIVKKTTLTFGDVFELKDAGIQYHRSGIGLSNKGGSDLYERIFCTKTENKFKRTKETWYGKLIERYYITDETDELFNLDYKEVLRKNESVSFTKEAFDKKERILWRQTAASLLAVLDTEGRWFRNTIQCGYLKNDYKNKVNILFSLAIFNSKYIDYVYRRMVLETGRVFPQVKIKYLRSLPFIIPQKGAQENLSESAAKMLDLHRGLAKETKDSEKWKKFKTDIERTDKEIDQEVYKLYSLTPEATKIVEGVI